MINNVLDGERQVISTQCSFCKHYIEGFKCNAYESDIPIDIWLDNVVHDHSISNDKGIFYEPTEAFSSVLIEWNTRD